MGNKPVMSKASERRGRGRIKMTQQARIRPSEPGGDQFDDIVTTENISRQGFYFLTTRKSYKPKMRLFVTYPYSEGTGSLLSEYLAEVVRIDQRESGQLGIAIHLISTINVHDRR
jgi:hypothetical protein